MLMLYSQNINNPLPSLYSFAHRHANFANLKRPTYFQKKKKTFKRSERISFWIVNNFGNPVKHSKPNGIFNADDVLQMIGNPYADKY